jgi:Fe-S oxidoreductase
MISVKCRDAAYASVPVAGRSQAPDRRPALLGDTLTAEELWACSTCGACEETCPVLIEYLDKVVDLRRRLVEEGEVPAGLQKPLADLEKRGNPFGKPARTRGDWCKNGSAGAGSGASRNGGPRGRGPRVLGRGDSARTLFFTDSVTAYDPRTQEIARSLALVLDRAGQEVGILGKDEVDSGHDVRRIGEEGLFEVLREKNTSALAEREFQTVVTADPHAFNSLRREYSIEVPVRHHTQVLAELARSGELPLAPLGDDRVHTFHDPCYLGRLGGEFEAPRAVLGAIPGLRTVEMERCRARSFCCGGGLLSLFHESERQERMAEARLDMARDAGAEVVVTACPFCLLNLSDAVQSRGLEGTLEVVDLAELVLRSMDRDTPGPGPDHGKEPA